MKAFVLLLFAIIVVGGNYTFVTWNKSGASWREVRKLANQFEVLGIQQAQRVPLVFNPTWEIAVNCSIVAEESDKNILLTPCDGSVKAYRFFHWSTPFYIYYYDPAEEYSGENKKNIALVSREAAAHVYIVMLDVDRPTIGISLSDYVVFTTHADPTPADNGVNETIEKVSRFMASRCDREKWILMGDFNAEPANIRLPSAPLGCLINLAYPAQVTKPGLANSNAGTVADYAVYGGPSSGTETLRATTQQDLRGSDHFPVLFKVVPNDI